MSNGKPNTITGSKSRRGENFINRKATVPNLPSTPTLPIVEPYNTGAPGVMTARDIWNQRLATGSYNKIAPLNTKEIYSGPRYNETIPGTDYEEMHAQQQSNWGKWSNATAKMIGTASTTFVTGTAGLLYGMGSALINLKLSNVVDNSVTRAMDDISRGMDDSLPNYYTQKETEAKWWSPDNIMTANFWSDKVLKNLGFSVGSMAGGMAWGALFRSIGMTNQLVRWGKGNDLATAVEKRLAVAPASARYPAFQSALNKTWTTAKMPMAAVAKNSDRILTSIMATAGEATIEGLQAMHTLRESLLDEFKLSHGRMPSGLELNAINETVQTAGLYIYGMNGLILTATNYIQLGKIIGSSRKADKALINSIRRNADTRLWEAALPKTIAGKVLGVAKHIGRLSFAPVEALEEGLQHAATTGVEDYFSRAYKNKNETNDLLRAVDDNMLNVYSNVYLHGLHETLNTKEGLESMLIGALSGGLQQMGLFGSYRDEKGKIKYGVGKSGEIGEYGLFGRGGTRGINTKRAVEELNLKQVEDVIKDGVNYMGVGIGSQKLRQQAIENDDILAEKDAEEDYALSYLMPRIKYGKLESVIEELTNYKTQAMSTTGYSELVTAGLANQNETADEFIQRIDNLLESANKTDKMYSLLNDRYENARSEDGTIAYTPEVIDKMVYAAAKIENYDKRIEEVQTALLSSGVDLTLIDEIIKNKDAIPTDAQWEEVSKTADNVKITEQETFSTNLLDYGELLLRRKKFAQEYETIKDAPYNYRAVVGALPPEESEEIKSTKENSITVPVTTGGEKTYNIDDTYYLGNVLADQIVSGADLSAPQMKILSMNEDGTIKIMTQNGKELDITAGELEQLKLGSVNKALKDNKKGEFYFDNWNTPFTFNFGDNGGFKKGRIIYNENDDKMHFVYVDASGNTRDIEVTNDQFGPKGENEAQIQREEGVNDFQGGVEARFLAAKDERKDKKHEDRLKVLGEFAEEMMVRQAELTKVINKRQENVARTKKILGLLQEDLLKNKDKRTKDAYTIAGQKILTNIKRTEKDLEALEKVERESSEELNDITATLVYVEDLIENIDTRATDYVNFIAEIKVDKVNLEELHKEVTTGIKDLKTLIQEVKDFIQTSKDVLNDLLLQLSGAFPNISSEGVFLDDIVTVEDYFTDLAPLIGGTESEESLAFAGVTLTGIQPKKAQLTKMEKELSNAKKALDKYDDGIIARGKVLAKFGERLIEWERAKEEEAILGTSSEISSDILDSQSKSSFENDHYKEGFEYKKLKAKNLVVTGGIAPEGSDGKPVGVYAKRAQAFGNIFHRLVQNGKEFRGRVVTIANEKHIMKGLTKHLAQPGTDPRFTIVLVVTNKKGVPVDEKGIPITDESKLLDEGIYQTFPDPKLRNSYGSLFRADVKFKERERITKIYEKWVEKTLGQSKLQPLQDISASFGLVDYIQKTDSKGKILPEATSMARSSINASGLITNIELGSGDVIKVATNNDTLTRGTVEISAPLGHVFLEAPGGYVKLYNQKNSEKQSELIYNVLLQVTKNILRDKHGKEADTQRLFEWLRSVVYWGQPMNFQTGERKEPSDGSVYYEVIGQGEGVASERKLRIGKTSRFDFTPTSLKDNKDAIIALLQNVWGNTHAPGVAKDMYDVAYHEITAVNKDGTTEGITWNSYQQFLLADIYPDGSPRNLDSIPLKTKVRPLVGKEDTNRHAIYFYLEDSSEYMQDAPVESIVKKTVPGKKEVSTPKYIFDGVVENIINLGTLGEAKVTLNLDEAVQEFHRREGKVFSSLEETQQFTFALLSKHIITIGLGTDVEANLVEAGGATDSSAQSNAQMLVVEMLSSQITEAANRTAAKSEPVPTLKSSITSVEDLIQDINDAFIYINSGKYKGDRKNEMTSVGDKLVKIFLTGLRKEGLVKAGTRRAPRADGSYDTMTINEDLKGKNIGNDWSAAKHFKEKLRTFFDTEIAELKSSTKITETTVRTEDKKWKLDGSPEVMTVGESKVTFTLKDQAVIDALRDDSEILEDEIKRLKLITGLIRGGHLVITPTQAALDNGEKLLGSTDALITMLANTILQEVAPQIKKNWFLADTDKGSENYSDAEWEEIQARFNPEGETSSRTEEDDYTRIIAERHLEPFKETNWEKEAEWMKKNFPLIPINVLKNVIQATNGRQAWGLYRQGAVYIYKHAEAGTIYHEVFHAVWDMSLSLREKRQIAEEFRNRKGSYTDRFTFKVIKYSEATDYQMGEEIAEEFRDRVLYGKKPTRKPRSLMRRAFEGIINFFNDLLFGKDAFTNTNKLFDKMGNGDYAAFIPHEDVLRKAGESQILHIEGITVRKGDQLRPLITRLEGINAVQEHEIYQHMTFVAVNKMFATDDGLFAMKDRLKITNLYQDLKRNLLGENGIINRKQIDYSQITIKNPKQQEQVTKKIKDLDDLKIAINENWDVIKKRHMDSLAPYEITFDEEENLIVEDETIVKADSMDGNKIDSYRKSSGAIKLLFATLADFEKVPGENRTRLKTSSIGGATFEQSDKIYITLKNNLHDSTGLNDMLERLKELANNEETGYHYAKLYTRITKQDISDTNKNTVNIDKMSNSAIMLLGGFWKVIKGQNPDVPIIFILQGGEVVIGNTELSNASKQIRYEMSQNIIAHIREDAEGNEKLYKINSLGLYNPTTALKNVKLNSSKPAEYIRFLQAFGINFKLKEFNKFLPDQKATFREATEGLLSDLSTRKDIYSWSEKAINSTQNLLKLGALRAVMDNPVFESTYFSIAGERTQKFIGPNATSDLFHTLSQITNKQDLRSTRYSHLLDDVFTQGSVVMQKLFNGNERKRNTKDIFKTVYVGGTINEENNRRTRSSRLYYRDRLIQEMSLNLEGIYANLVPGDSELEWAIKMHSKKSPFITPSSVSRKEYQKIFRDYFIDEVNLSRDNRIVAKGRSARDLRFFKDILDAYNSKAHATILDYSHKISAEEIYEEHKSGIKAAVEAFITNDAEETMTLLKDYKIIQKIPGEAEIYKHTLSLKDKELSFTEMELQIKSLTVNYMIANIEQHKILYSDPYQYSDELKRIKNFNSPRQALMHSSKDLYKAINKVYNKGYKAEDLGYSNMDRSSFRTVTLQDIWSIIDPKLAKQYPGYTDYKNKEGWQETDGAGMITMKAYRFFRILAGDWLPNNEAQYRWDIQYQEKVMEINDATGTEKSRLNEKFRAFKAARKVHDQSTYTPIKPIVSGNKGNGRNYNDSVLDKYALFPMPFRVFHMMEPNSNILEFTEKMRREKIDYAIYETGRKVGVEETYPVYVKGALNTAPFQPQEEIDRVAENNPEDRVKRFVTNIPFSIMSLQTEVPSKKDGKVIQGSQITKLVTLDFMNGGVPIDFNPVDKDGNSIVTEDKDGKDTTDYDALSVAWVELETEAAKKEASLLYKEIQHNKRLLQERIQLGYENLLRKLGIIEDEDEDGNKTYTVFDKEKLIGTIEKEIFKQQKNNNLVVAFQEVREGKALIEATPVYQQIRNVLYSLANGNVVRPKISGGSKIQMPSTLFEVGARIEKFVHDGKTYLHSDVLNFYEEGKVAEIFVARWDNSPLSDEQLLNSWYKLDENDNRTSELTKEGERALKGIAFRTPTQKQNSIESYVIKKFLPRSYGDSVVIPSAIVRKTGSDYDIDKLSVYLKNLIWDGKRLFSVPFQGFQSELDAKREFKKIFHRLMENRISKVEGKKAKVISLKAMFTKIANGTAEFEEFEEFTPIISTLLENNNISLKDTEAINEYFDQRLGNGIARINTLTVKQFEEDAAQKFADKLYSQSIENEYIESLQRLVMHPKNYHNLIKPNSAQIMRDLTDHINEKFRRTKIDYHSAGFMLSRKKMSGLRQAFVGGKRAIGIAAVGATNNSNNQLADTYTDTNLIGTNIISDEDEFWLNGMKITKIADDTDADVKFLEYNKKMVDGRPMASLSRAKNSAGEYISDIIGMFIDGYVDISAGPWIMQMGATPETAGTWLYLLKIGVPKETVAYFMNQPIITELLFDLEIEGKSWLYNRNRIFDLLKLYAGSKANIAMIPSERGLDTMMGKKRGELSLLQKTQQQFILKEFLKYSKQADHLFLVTQGTNFDTATLNDPFLIFKKSRLFKMAQKTVISSAQKILDTSFLGYLKDTMDKIRGAYSVILLSDKNDPNKAITPRKVLERVLLPYIRMSDREFVGLSQKVVADFFDWAMQTDRSIKSSFNSLIVEILLGTDTERSAAKQIIQFKEDIFGREADANKGILAIAPKENHPLYNNMILKSFVLVPGARKNVPDNLIIKAKDNKVYDQNQTINSFEEIKDYLSSLKGSNSKYAGLYEKMVRLAVIQSGLSTSPISFSKLLPYEDFKEIYNHTLLNLEANPTIENYASLNVFERSNWNKGKWISTITRKVDYDEHDTRIVRTEDNVDYRLSSAEDKFEIPKVVFISEGNPNASEVIVYKWSIPITQDERIKRSKTGNTSHLKSQLMRKVYYDRGVEPIPLIQVHDEFNPYTGRNISYRGFVYVAINAWGDSFRGREFYNSVDGTNVKATVLDNGFEKVIEDQDIVGNKISSGEVTDEKVIEILSRKMLVAGNRVTSEDTKITPSSIYETLGDKTASRNVVIENVFQATGVKFAKSIGGIFSMRLKGSDKHFGNPFSSTIKDKSLIATKSTRESVERYIDWIIRGTDTRAKWIRTQLETGDLKRRPIVYYKELGEPSHATALDYLINQKDWTEPKLTREESTELEELKAKRETLETNPEYIVLNSIPKITPASAKKETGGKVGINQDINPSWLSKAGVTIEKAAENIYADNFSESNEYSEQDIRNYIIGALLKSKVEAKREIFDEKRLDELLNPGNKEDILSQTDDMNVSVATSNTIERMKAAAASMGINLTSLLNYAKDNPDVDVTNVNGIADLTQGIIAIAEGKEDVAITEELIHIGSAIVEANDPKRITALISKIADFKIYKTVLDAYKGKKAYQLPNGKPDIRKIKKEAIDKLMAEVVVNGANGSTDFPELSDLTVVGRIKEMWNSLLRYIRGVYRVSTIDIFKETGEMIVEGNIGTVDDIVSTGVFSQMATENQPLNDLYKRLLEEDNRLTLYEENEIPGKKRHYTYVDPITGETVDVDFSVTEDIKLQKEKTGKTFAPRSPQNKMIDAFKMKWGNSGHKYLEAWLKINLIDKETGFAKSIPGTDPVDNFGLEDEVTQELENFIKQLVDSYPKGTKFLAEPMVINKQNRNRTLASAIDFVALIPVERNNKPDVKIEMLDWKFTTILESDKVPDIPWYSQSTWKSQMGEYTKMLRGYGMKNYQLQKARMIPFIMTYGEDIPGSPWRGLYASQVEIGDVNSLKETNIYLLPVPVNIEPTGIAVVDKLLFELNAYYQRNYAYDGKLNADEQKEKEKKLNNLKVAIRRLHVARDFKPLVGVAQNFVKAAQTVFDKFDVMDYATEDPKVISTLLHELSTLKRDSFRFEGINRIFLETYKDKEFDKEENKILQDLGDVSVEIEKMLVKIVEHQNERAKYINLNLSYTTEEEGDSILTPSRELKRMAKLFKEGSKLSNKRANAIAAIVLQGKNEVELRFNKEMFKFNRIFKKLYAQANSRGVSSFSLIGKIGKAGDTKEGAEDTLQIYDKVKPNFMKDLQRARTDRDKTFITTHIDMKAHNKYINAEMKKQEAELNAHVFNPNDEADNDISKTVAIDKMRNSLDIYRTTFNGWNSHHFLESMFANVKENDPEYQTQEYKDMAKNQVALDAWNYVREWGDRAKVNGHIPQWKDAFFPLIEADSMAKFMQSKKGTIANIKEYFLDAITGRIDESKGYTNIDPETGEARESIPVYFTRSNKDVEYMTQDISKAVPMWVHSILDFEASLAMEADLNLMVDVEENIGVFIVDARRKIQRVAGEPQVTKSKNANIAVLRGQVSDAIYGQREDVDELGNVEITALAARLTKIFGGSEEQMDQIATEIRIKKILEGANNWVRNLGVGLKPAIAIANAAGQTMLSYIYKSGVYRGREYAKNTTKVMSNNLSTKERGLLHFISAFSENNLILQRRLAKNGFMSYLNTWSMTDIIQSTNSYPEIILQRINGLSMMENTIVVDGKLLNVREVVLAEDRATKEKGISQAARRALNDSYEDRVAARKVSETQLIEVVEVSEKGVEFPGVSIEELAKLRVRIMEYSRKLNGQMDENDKAAYRRSIIMNSFMMFKHWVPKLLEGRFHGIHKNLQSDNWEYGRSRLMAKTLLKLASTSILKMSDLIHQTDEGKKIMDQMLEEKMIAHFDKTGQVLQITREEWYDLMRQELSRQMRELQMVLMVFTILMSIKAAEPPENISAGDRSRFNYLLRVLNKVTDEILFFYNPTSFEGMTTGSIMPAVTLLSKAGKILNAIRKATVAETEKERENANVAKHILNIVPIGYQVSKTFIPLIDAELAKDMGNRISPETNRR